MRLTYTVEPAATAFIDPESAMVTNDNKSSDSVSERADRLLAVRGIVINLVLRWSPPTESDRMAPAMELL
jgi:hypothetical protein